MPGDLDCRCGAPGPVVRRGILTGRRRCTWAAWRLRGRGSASDSPGGGSPGRNRLPPRLRAPTGLPAVDAPRPAAIDLARWLLPPAPRPATPSRARSRPRGDLPTRGGRRVHRPASVGDLKDEVSSRLASRETTGRLRALPPDASPLPFRRGPPAVHPARSASRPDPAARARAARRPPSAADPRCREDSPRARHPREVRATGLSARRVRTYHPVARPTRPRAAGAPVPGPRPASRRARHRQHPSAIDPACSASGGRRHRRPPQLDAVADLQSAALRASGRAGPLAGESGPLQCGGARESIAT